MSTHTVYRCDKCGAGVEREHELYLHLGREMDAAGSMENVGEGVHLCHSCALVILRAATRATPTALFGQLDRERLLSFIRSGAKPQ